MMQGTTPDVTNNYLKANGGYSGNSIVWSAANELGAYSFSERIKGTMTGTQLNAGMSAGQAYVANVHRGGHWVLIAGKCGASTCPVNDPGSRSTKTYATSDMVGFAVYA